MAITVNGVAIPPERVVQEMERLRGSYEAYVREQGGEPGEGQLREWAEDNLIEEELFRQEALATQPPPSDERVRQNIEENPAFYSGLPEAERLARSREALCVRGLQKALRKRLPKMSDADLRREYDQHPELFTSRETLHLSHICRLIGPEGAPRAEALLELLRLKAELEGDTLRWSEIMHTSDSYQEDFGVFMPVGRGDLPAEAEEQLFALKEGEISDVIELDGLSLHLFFLLSRNPPAPFKFAEVRDQLRAVQFERAFRDAFDALCDTLKQKAVIQRGE